MPLFLPDVAFSTVINLLELKIILQKLNFSSLFLILALSEENVFSLWLFVYPINRIFTNKIGYYIFHQNILRTDLFY